MPLSLTRVGNVPTETYGQATIHWLASHAASGAAELTVGLTTIQPGGGTPMHRHPNCEEVLHLLTGQMDQLIEGHPALHMTPGDTVTIPRNLPHGAKNTGPTPAVMIVVFSSPRRETILI